MAVTSRGSLHLLVWFLRILGMLDLAALAVCAFPLEWIDIVHRWAGLGAFPESPIASYLARSASAMYALHALTILYLSGDVERYLGLIRFLGWLAIGHGVLLLGIDFVVGMPAWWMWVEGPTFAATGLVVLILIWLSRSRKETGGFRDAIEGPGRGLDGLT